MALPGITIRDVDANDSYSAAMTVDITAGHGTVSLSFHSDAAPAGPLGTDLAGLFFSRGRGRADRHVTFRATLADANRALAGLRFRPDDDYHGTGAHVTIAVDDNGASGAEDPLVVRRGQLTIPLSFRAVNDPPVITVPTAEDGSHQVGDK